jgi:hypothetical protein
MTTDAGSGFDQAAGRDAAANLDEIEEESRHLAGDEAGEAVGDKDPEDVLEEERERKRVHDEVNDAF